MWRRVILFLLWSSQLTFHGDNFRAGVFWNSPFFLISISVILAVFTHEDQSSRLQLTSTTTIVSIFQNYYFALLNLAGEYNQSAIEVQREKTIFQI